MAKLSRISCLRKLLNDYFYFSVEFEGVSKDEPISSSNIYYIRKRLTEKIENSDVVPGLTGIYASHSDWVE